MKPSENKPVQVTRAVQLLYAAVCLIPVQLLAGLWYDWSSVTMEAIAPYLTVYVLYIGLLVFLARKIFLGRNWARIALFVILIFGAAGTFRRYAEVVSCCPVVAYVGIAHFTFLVLAATMLTGWTSTAWFRQQGRRAV